jgi:NADH-quinone oxidoreductase subunit K
VGVAGFVVFAIVNVIVVKHLGGSRAAHAPPLPADYSNTRELGTALFTRYAYPAQLAAVILLVASVAAIVLTLRPPQGRQAAGHRRSRSRCAPGTACASSKWQRRSAHDHLTHVLTLSGILFAIAVAGVFLNRKNIIILLMCIELMLLAVNFNFVAFSRFLGDINGQIFVFFILTVAAAESAIGLAILVVLFRERRSINVEDLDTLQG